MAALLRLIAVVASVLVLAGFAAFAGDEAKGGSEQQVGRLSEHTSQPAPAASTERERERRHGPVREAVDDANDVLLAPFTGVTSSGSAWVQRLVALGLGLLVYAFALPLLANALPRGSRAPSDWRQATP
jgi:hypothetical protein